MVLIDASSEGLSFVASQNIEVDSRLLIVLAGYSVITGNMDIEILRKQTIKDNLHRYGAKIHFASPGINEARVTRRSYEVILKNCQQHGESLAPWQ